MKYVLGLGIAMPFLSALWAIGAAWSAYIVTVIWEWYLGEELSIALPFAAIMIWRIVQGPRAPDTKDTRTRSEVMTDFGKHLVAVFIGPLVILGSAWIGLFFL